VSLTNDCSENSQISLDKFIEKLPAVQEWSKAGLVDKIARFLAETNQVHTTYTDIYKCYKCKLTHAVV